MKVGRLGYFGLSRSNQKPASSALAEVKREFYTRKLARLAAIAAVVAIIIFAWSVLVPPKFDEVYVKSLLSRHDPSVSSAEFTDMSGSDELNYSFEESVATDYFFDDKYAVGTRTASVTKDDNGTVIGGELVVVRSTPTTIGAADRVWNCPDGTWMNVSTEETRDYLYVGATGSAFARAALQISEEEAGAVTALNQIIVGINASKKADPVMASLPMNITATQLFYFRPDERDRYEYEIEGLVELVDGCEEVG